MDIYQEAALANRFGKMATAAGMEQVIPASQTSNQVIAEALVLGKVTIEVAYIDHSTGNRVMLSSEYPYGQCSNFVYTFCRPSADEADRFCGVLVFSPHVDEDFDRMLYVLAYMGFDIRPTDLTDADVFAEDIQS